MNETINLPAKEILIKYKNHIGLRGSLQTDELLEHLEPELGIECLISELAYNNIYLPEYYYEKVVWLAKILRLEEGYIQAIQKNYIDENLLTQKLINILDGLNISNIDKNTLQNDILNKTLNLFFEKLIKEICNNNLHISSDQYKELMRIGYLIDGVDPSICLKINQNVSSHIENNKFLHKKLLDLISEFRNFLPLPYINQIVDFIKYDEIENCLDSLCYFVAISEKKITQQTYNRIMEIAKTLNLEKKILDISRFVE